MKYLNYCLVPFQCVLAYIGLIFWPNEIKPLPRNRQAVRVAEKLALPFVFVLTCIGVGIWCFGQFLLYAHDMITSSPNRYL